MSHPAEPEREVEPQHQPGVEVDAAAAGDEVSQQEEGSEQLRIDSSDYDSGLEDISSLSSATTSLRPSIYEAVEENGRTYHRYKEGSYYLPNDEREQDRLDLQHRLFLFALHDELYLSPVMRPRRVLDIGTGTGNWAIDMAVRHPDTDVLGTDLSPVQPEVVPANCRFEVDDAADTWIYSARFDLIHGRCLFSCFQDHKSVFQSAFDNLSPGGFLEMQDVCATEFLDDSGTGSAIEEWNMKVLEAAAKIGRDWRCTKRYAEWLREVGFVDVVEKVIQCPMNPQWPKGRYYKTLGAFTQQDLLEGLEGLSIAILTRVLGMAVEDVKELVARASDDLRDKRVHCYTPMYIVYGRKPMDGEGEGLSIDK